MAEYIKRKDALVAIQNLYPGIPFTKVARQRWHDNNRSYMQCERAIESIPAADVVEVRRGRWIYDCERTMGDGWIYKQYHCSACGKQEIGAMQNYCPNCGAKNDGGVNDGKAD